MNLELFMAEEIKKFTLQKNKRVSFSDELFTIIEIPRCCPSRSSHMDEFTYKFECDKCKKIQYKSFYYGRCDCDIYVCRDCYLKCSSKVLYYLF